MKIDITTNEVSTGLIKKTKHHQVNLTVLFSEEEKQIISDCELGKVIVLERGTPSNRKDSVEGLWNLTIDMLVYGKDEYAFATPAEAKNYVEELKEQLPLLKDHIMSNADGVEDTSFEL
jgi:hypothetical protein